MLCSELGLDSGMMPGCKIKERLLHARIIKSKAKNMYLSGRWTTHTTHLDRLNCWQFTDHWCLCNEYTELLHDSMTLHLWQTVCSSLLPISIVLNIRYCCMASFKKSNEQFPRMMYPTVQLIKTLTVSYVIPKCITKLTLSFTAI